MGNLKSKKTEYSNCASNAGWMLIVFASCTILLVQGQTMAGTQDGLSVVYSNNFETMGDPLTEWSVTTTDVTPVNNRRFLGQFGSQIITLTLQNLPAHTTATLSFDLFVIRSWDGNNDPDRFMVNVPNGPLLLDTTFSTHATQSYPGSYEASNPADTGACEVDSLGYDFDDGQPMNAVYCDLGGTFAHSANTLIVDFRAILDTPGSNESWGIDNVEISVNACLAPRFGDVFPCGTGDGFVNADDVLALLDTFGGNQPCADPCEIGRASCRERV